MELKTKRLSGSQYSADDVLEAQLDTGGVDVAFAYHTINVVSGEQVTHGGGAVAGEYLWYRNPENNDYSVVEIAVVQLDKGTSVVNVSCTVVTKAEEDTFQTELTEYNRRQDEFNEDGGSSPHFSEQPPTVSSTTLTSGDITLEWDDDALV